MARIRGFLGAHPLVVDAGTAILLTGAMFAGTRTTATAVGLTLLAGLPLVARRFAPMTVLVVSVVALLGYQSLGGPSGLHQLGPELALASLASLRPWRWTVVGAVVLAPGLLSGNLRDWNGSRFDVVVLSTVWIVTICVAGQAVRRLREHDEAAERDAARRVGEQREREQQAVLLERVHIARELHDVVAHHMSVIAVQAGLARYVLPSDPATSERALLAVAEMSSEGLAEVRRLVRVLRPDLDHSAAAEEDHRDTPGIDELPLMIERVGLTGVAIEFTVSGVAQPLAAGVGLCLYRVVQEALTNVIKHARGARVTVLLYYESHQVTVRVTNDARGSDVRGARELRVDGGKGLTGMYERAMLYGGTLTAGELPRGGFEVVLTLPIRVTQTTSAGQASSFAAASAQEE